MFQEHKISLLKGFLKDHVTVKKIQCCYHYAIYYAIRTLLMFAMTKTVLHYHVTCRLNF